MTRRDSGALTESLTCKLTSAERDVVAAAAKAAGRSLSGHVRARLVGHGVASNYPEAVALSGLLQTLARVGLSTGEETSAAIVTELKAAIAELRPLLLRRLA